MKRIMIAACMAGEDVYDDYLLAFEQLGTEAFISLRTEDLLTADGLVLPGSSQDIDPKLWGEEDQGSNDINGELDAAQWALMDQAVARKMPVLGICRGIQFINVYFGGTLIQDLPCSAFHKAARPEQYHQVEFAPQSKLHAAFGPVSEVNSRHHQGAGRVGDGLNVCALWKGGDDTVIEAVAHQTYPILGVQWHPEKMYLYGTGQHRADGEKLLRNWLNQK